MNVHASMSAWLVASRNKGRADGACGRIGMEREIDLGEVSDGKLYTSGDLVRIGCNDCTGCSECCRVVEDTILLDPYDIYQLERRLSLIHI